MCIYSNDAPPLGGAEIGEEGLLLSHPHTHSYTQKAQSQSVSVDSGKIQSSELVVPIL